MNAVFLLNGFLLNLYRKKKGIWSEVHSSSRPLAVPTPQLPNYQSPEMPETAPAPKAREEH